MSEPIERLSRFTPDASGLDRDALLFAAGRASVRPNQRWHALCAALATTQLLTLGLVFWPRPVTLPPGDTTPPVAFVEPPPAPNFDPPPLTPALWQLEEPALATEGNLPAPALMENSVENEPPLHAFGPLPVALLN